jgi:hypothetical protein
MSYYILTRSQEETIQESITYLYLHEIMILTNKTTSHLNNETSSLNIRRKL